MRGEDRVRRGLVDERGDARGETAVSMTALGSTVPVPRPAPGAEPLPDPVPLPPQAFPGPLAALRRLWTVTGYCALVALLALLGGAGGLLVARQGATTYGAATTVFFSLPSGDSLSEAAQGATYTQDLMESYAAVVTKPAVLAPVISQLGLHTTTTALAERVTAKVRPGTVLLEIDVTAPTAAGAAQLASAVTDEFSSTVRDLAPVSRSGERLVDLRTVATAAVPATPMPRHTLRWVALGALLGAFLGLAGSVARESSSPRVRSAEDVRRVLAAPVLAVLPRRRGRALVTVDEDSAQADALRRLRATVLAAARRDGVRSLVVTSLGRSPSVPLAADLAVVLAEAGVPVLVTEVDLRRPVLAELFGLSGDEGLGDVLAGRVRLDEATQAWPGGVEVLPGGRPVAHPHQLVAGPGLAKVVQAESGRAELTLVDAGARVFPADTGELAAHVDGVVLVAPAGRTGRRALVEAAAGVEGAGGTVVGVVLIGGARRPAPWTR